MPWNDIEWYSDLNPNCTAKLTLKSSDGWSGNVVHYGYNVDISHRQFYFKIDGTESGTPWGTYRTYTDGNCRTGVLDVNDAIIGISLEHMGKYLNTTYNYEVVQFKGKDISSDFPSWGAKEDDTALRLMSDCFSCDLVTVVDEQGNETDYTDVNFNHVSWVPGEFLNYIECQINGYHFEVEIDTDLPIFETDADLLEYCRSGGTITNKILNQSDEPTPEEEYENKFKFHYLKNIFGKNTRNASSYTGFRNYRFYPQSQRMCLYRVTPTENNPFTLRLKGYSGATIKSAPVYANPFNDDDKYTTVSGTPELYYLHKSIAIGDDYYSQFAYITDLPIYGDEQTADDYLNELIDERSAENWNDISRAYDETYDPQYGDPDTGNDNGYNGQSYVKGARLWVMSSLDLDDFFDDIFSDVNISQILNGTQLFGSSAISCIMGVAYLPIDVEDVATVNGTKQSIKLGSWTCPTAQGKFVWNNNKMIDCGSFVVTRVYNDFRDYEMKLYLDLPYCGTIELSIGRFLDKTLSVKYAVDITTGGCTAHIYADNIEMESVDGYMASVRPIQAIDQISHLNAVMGIVGSIGSRETGMINTATESFAGVATGSIGQTSNGGFNAPSSGVGPGGALELSAGAITDLYSLGQAVKDKPIAVRGSYAGCLGLFGPQKIHIRVAQPRVYRANNATELVGLPSGIGQRVGMFSGFLSVMSFQMADGFTGTGDELQEIYGLLKQGIYV